MLFYFFYNILSRCSLDTGFERLMYEIIRGNAPNKHVLSEQTAYRSMHTGFASLSEVALIVQNIRDLKIKAKNK